MAELIYLIMIVSSITLFSLGGMYLKALRRYLMPLAIFGCLIVLGVDIVQAILSCVLLSVVLHLGYGESVNWFGKFLVGCSYSLPSLVIGYSVWVFIMPVLFIVMFFLSNWAPTKESFTWRIVEAGWAFCIACTFIGALQCPWG